jgi:hypothetical protein
MKKCLVVLTVLALAAGAACAAVRPASKAEVSYSVERIEQFVKAGQENMVSVYGAAIEVEKQATGAQRARAIAEKVATTSKTDLADVEKIRDRSGFSELAIM